MVPVSAVFVGNGSLLVSCAEAFAHAGHAIRGVVSRNPDILGWAQARGLSAFAMDEPQALALPGLEFDYLFSVANLDILPGELIGRALKLAVNFHDALLPSYAGLNATSWALMAQEKTHGVSWHEMTVTVDAGRIVRQASIPVADEETALSLNTKCYEAGLSTFEAIVADLGKGDLSLTPQHGVRSYFGKSRRPSTLGTLDFSRPAHELASLVRALDFGSYPNPLGRPKVFTGGQTLGVASARVEPRSSGAEPGTILSTHADGWRVATIDDDLILGGLTDWEGRPAAPAFSAGAVLPPVESAVKLQLDSSLPSIAKGELYWSRAWQILEPVQLPHARHVVAAGDRATSPTRVALTVPSGKETSVAGFAAWLSALTGQSRVSFWFTDGSLDSSVRGLESWLSAWVPLTLTTEPGDSVAQAKDHARSRLAEIHEAGPYPKDLPVRLGSQALAMFGRGKLAVSLRHASLPAGFDMLLTTDAAGESLELVADSRLFSQETIESMARQLTFYLSRFAVADSPIASVPLVSPEEAGVLRTLNATASPYEQALCVPEAIAAQSARTPDHAAICFGQQELSYRALLQKVDGLARSLIARGVQPGDVVGLFLPRTPDLVIALLAIQRAGAAYLPLDPDYPADRLAFMVEDSQTRLVVTSAALAGRLKLPVNQTFVCDTSSDAAASSDIALPMLSADSPAYVIYTSGSTGRPKGVVVTHRNVMNFFAGMSERVPAGDRGRWLAVTSLSFDISVLELCWTLTRGFTVVLYSKYSEASEEPTTQFSLFYFASEETAGSHDRYRLLMEGAKFADQNGFHSVWTPERHFHAFGGLYPNPAVTSAAIAAVTTRVQIRAGSCVLPLHHPIRVAEDWALVDNISKGRVGVSFAAGWQPNDFVIAPDAFANRKTDMMNNIDVVRRLWRGESVSFPGPVGKPVSVQTLPRPIQPELPVWLTAAGNPETFEQAGELGCRLLTHLLGQTTDELARKLALYRAAWQRAGHPGTGHVTLMLHTFVGSSNEAVRETVREPMKAYLKSSVDLIKQAAWSFPTFVERGAANGKSPVEIMDSQDLSDEDMDALLEHAFSRYYASSGLFGTPERCLGLVGKLQQSGVDEIACLIDFGVDTDTVLAHLEDLKQLMDLARTSQSGLPPASVAEQIASHAITHLQCTPSMASMLVADAAGRTAVSSLSALLVGGEALPPDLARQLRSLVPGKLLNMYGPTETTVWSTTCDLAEIGQFIPLGQPIANTRLSVRTPWGQECPSGVPGELLIGGDGVTRGYLHRPELTAERFIDDEQEPGSRLYRTGDLVRRHRDGALEFLGRIDNQVKLRGHRIELGEIENALMRRPEVKDAVVVARADASGEPFLAAYVTGQPGSSFDVDALKAALGRELAEIMLPRTITLLAAFPLTPNGKVDRRALPDTAAAAPLQEQTLPENQIEQMISSIWQDVLGLKKVGTSDNFFDLGGHSLLVVQVQRRLQDATGREISITDMFRLPTIRSLAQHLGGATGPTAVSEGQSRAQARRSMRSRSSLIQANTALAEVDHAN